MVVVVSWKWCHRMVACGGCFIYFNYLGTQHYRCMVMLAVFCISHRMGVKLGESWFGPYKTMTVTKPGLYKVESH